jgi:hypothetical protein
VNDIDLGFSAGYYEGEGSIVRGERGITMKISSIDVEPLQRMQRLWGGSLSGPKIPRKNTHSVYWEWIITNGLEINTFTSAIKSQLSPRRVLQMEKALSGYAVIRGIRGPNLGPGLQCPDKPIPSQVGYQRHRKLGIPACDICKASFALYQSELRRRKIHPEAKLHCPPEPIPSEYPYIAHQRLGIPACDICLESRRLYRQQLKERHATPRDLA